MFAVLTAVWFLAFVFAGASPLLWGATKMLDLRGYYSDVEAMTFLTAFRDGGAELAVAYETYEALDRFFPAIYAMAFIGWSLALRAGIAPVVLAALAALADWNENAAVAAFIGGGDLGNAAIFTLAKFTCLFAALALIVLRYCGCDVFRWLK